MVNCADEIAKIVAKYKKQYLESVVRIDIPCKDDAEWRFWLLFEDDNVAWNISNEDKEYVKQEAIKHCLYIEKIILIHGYQKKHLINQKKF